MPTRNVEQSSGRRRPRSDNRAGFMKALLPPSMVRLGLGILLTLTLDEIRFSSSFAPQPCSVAEQIQRRIRPIHPGSCSGIRTLAPGKRVTGLGSSLVALPDLNSTTPTPSMAYSDDDPILNSKADDGRSDEIIASIADYFGARQDGDGSGGKDIDGTTSFTSRRGPRKRANIQFVAGSGKTYIAWKVIERLLLPGDRSSPPMYEKNEGSSNSSSKMKIGLYVTPYLNLVDQALNNREEHGILMEAPTAIGGASVETMIVASKTSRKQEMCTTNVDDIMAFLKDSQGVESLKIFVCTYNSLPRVGEAIERLKLESARDCRDDKTGFVEDRDSTVIVDFAVFDEAHKLEGLSRPGLKNSTSFAYGLFDSNIEIQNRLFMTGTPNNYTQNAKIIRGFPTRTRADGSTSFIPENKEYNGNGDGYEEEEGLSTTHSAKQKFKIRSFSDASLFGPCLAHKTHQRSVEENITVPISLYGVEIDIFREYDSNGKIGDVLEKDRYLPLAIKSAFQKLPIKHAVVFHSTNQRAKEFLVSMDEVLGGDEDDEQNTIALFNMNYKTPPSEKFKILQDAKEAPRSLITNCRLLRMGVDNASWDMVVIADPVKSSVDGRQMIGRVGRKAPGKERGYVLVPIPVSVDGMNIDDSAYQIFINTFQHMVSLSPELRKDVLFVIKKSKEKRRPLSQSEYPDRLREAFVLPRTMPLEFQNLLMKCAIVAYDNSEAHAFRWDMMFELLTTYKEREGHCLVPDSHKEDEKNLGTWLNTQRQNKKKGVLRKEWEDRLNDVGMVWDVLSQKWEDMYSLLLKYKEREGHCLVPRTHKEDEKNLGAWLNNQCQNKKKGVLEKEWEDRLNDVGMVWDVFSQKWEDMYSLLLQYKEREGHCLVPDTHKEDEKNLGSWLNTQRQNKKKGVLEKEWEDRLNDVGMVWDVLSQQWEDMYSLLMQYKEREGHCLVPNTHKEDEKNLGAWLNTQRQNKEKGKLSSERERRLGSIGVF